MTATDEETLRFGVLGTLEVRRGSRSCVPSALKPRLLLAALLVCEGRVVSVAELVGAVWGERPPRTAGTALQVYVSQLRRLLGAGDGARACALRTRAPGYALALGPGARLDSADFESRCARADDARARGRLEEASALLDEALALWRAPALADVRTGPLLEPAAWRLDEARMLAVEQRVDIGLERGRHARLTVELAALAAEHPLRENLQRQLLLALYRSGRPADALRHYARFRDRLHEELGLEPGPSLQRLHLAILRRDPALEPPCGDRVTA
ncbi:AfsR/SARP family transcriptional regulator [Streptomyces sp. NPDC003077]|uniref:AfsR/SARP family transcriptional regulator n=1 Tax=Streptomyces sp. NPDC003077 TaxID=3154443 RepID=UPI0033A03B89